MLTPAAKAKDFGHCLAFTSGGCWAHIKFRMMIAAVIKETGNAIDITAAAKILFPMKAVTPPVIDAIGRKAYPYCCNTAYPATRKPMPVMAPSKRHN